jgi:hypothetical protein
MVIVETIVIGEKMTPEQSKHTTIWVERSVRTKLGKLAQMNHRTISGQIAYLVQKEYTREIDSDKQICQEQSK